MQANVNSDSVKLTYVIDKQRNLVTAIFRKWLELGLGLGLEDTN